MPDHQIIPAAANTRAVYNFDGTLEAIDDVIAWRVETESVRDTLRSHVVAITVDGDADGGVVGVQHADMSVTLFARAKYPSIDAAQQDFKAS